VVDHTLPVAKMNKVKDLAVILLIGVFSLLSLYLLSNKKPSCRRETARRFVSLNISLCQSTSLKVIRNYTLE